ncbi:hypothetical protein CH063_01315, partial [Colletotrichum higginsianum]
RGHPPLSDQGNHRPELLLRLQLCSKPDCGSEPEPRRHVLSFRQRHLRWLLSRSPTILSAFGSVSAESPPPLVSFENGFRCNRSNCISKSTVLMTGMLESAVLEAFL